MHDGQRVLIHAGAGGVGTFAVQLAKARGAHVITTAGPRNLDFVKQVSLSATVSNLSWHRCSHGRPLSACGVFWSGTYAGRLLQALISQY